MDTPEDVPSATATIESQELEELKPTLRNVMEGVARVAKRVDEHKESIARLKESTAELTAALAELQADRNRRQAEKDRARFLDACMISMLGVLLEQALKYTVEEIPDFSAMCPSWRTLPGCLRRPWMQDKLELFPPAFFQAVKDDDIELRPAFRIVEGAKAVKHLRTKEAHGRSFRTTCLEVLVCVGKVGTRRANSILANVPIDYLHD